MITHKTSHITTPTLLVGTNILANMIKTTMNIFKIGINIALAKCPNPELVLLMTTLIQHESYAIANDVTARHWQCLHFGQTVIAIFVVYPFVPTLAYL